MLIVQLARLAAHYRTVVCCLLLIWAVCTILGTLYLTSWNKSVMSGSSDQHYVDIQYLMRSRALFNSRNPKIARSLKYCSPLLNGGESEEGLDIPGSTLESVTVVTRHGDRGPLQEFIGLSSIDCSVNRTKDADYDKFILHMKTTLLMAGPTIKSHYLRQFQPFSPIPRGGTVCLPGQLSEWGALQQMRTGRLLRKAYLGHAIFRPADNYTDVLDHNLVSVVSSLYERTYQSAVAFLYGFLQKFDLTSVPFKAGLSSSLCYTQQYCKCPLVDKLRYLVERDKHDYVVSHPAVQNLLEKMNKVLLPTRRLIDASPEALFDQLLVFVCHQTSLPCRDEQSCVTVDQLNNLVSFIEWRGKLLAKTSRVKLLSRLAAQGHLLDILGKMENIRRAVKLKKRGPALVLFSAHDVTLMPLLVVMGIYDGLRPPFSSRLVFELHSRPSITVAAAAATTTTASAPSPLSSTDTQQQQQQRRDEKIFHMRILYNGRDVTRRVTFCEHVAAKEETFKPDYDAVIINATTTSSKQEKVAAVQAFCLLDSFAQFVNEDYLKELNVSSFQQACGLSAP